MSALRSQTPSMTEPMAHEEALMADKMAELREERDRLKAENAQLRKLLVSSREFVCTDCGLRIERGEKPNVEF